MNIRDLSGPVPELVPAGAVMVVTARTATATHHARALEAQALALAAPVVKVDNAEDQAVAVKAQAALASYVKAINRAADEAKGPLNDLRAKIIALNKELIAKVDAEGNRIGRLISDFQIAEQNRVAALRRLQDSRTTILEAELDQKLAQAGSVDEQEAIKEQYRDELAAQAKPIEPARAAGQVVKEDWSVQIVDIWLLARAHPGCVNLEPRMSDIKALLNAGVKVAGVRAEKVVKASVRLRQAPAIDINPAPA